MSINPEVFVRRQKLRRIFETSFRDINNSIKASARKLGLEPFFVKYSDHLLDRAIQREIDEAYVFTLFNKFHEHVAEVQEFLALEPLPETDELIDPVKSYRPLRLELTDGTLWLGMTVDRKMPGKMYSLKCRMAFVNDQRKEGKISTKVIKIN